MHSTLRHQLQSAQISNSMQNRLLSQIDYVCEIPGGVGRRCGGRVIFGRQSTRDYCAASLGKLRDDEQLSSGQIFLSTPNNHERFLYFIFRHSGSAYLGQTLYGFCCPGIVLNFGAKILMLYPVRKRKWNRLQMALFSLVSIIAIVLLKVEPQA